MTERAVTAIVAQRDGFCQSDIEAERAGNCPGHLSHLEGVGKAGPLVVVRENEDLCLAS
jgi:hypothetical protein